MLSKTHTNLHHYNMWGKVINVDHVHCVYSVHCYNWLGVRGKHVKNQQIVRLIVKSDWIETKAVFATRNLTTVTIQSETTSQLISQQTSSNRYRSLPPSYWTADRSDRTHTQLTLLSPSYCQRSLIKKNFNMRERTLKGGRNSDRKIQGTITF